MTAISRPRPGQPGDEQHPLGWALEEDLPKPSRLPASAQRVLRASEWAWIALSVLIAACLGTAAVTGTVWIVIHLIHTLQ